MSSEEGWERRCESGKNKPSHAHLHIYWFCIVLFGYYFADGDVDVLVSSLSLHLSIRLCMETEYLHKHPFTIPSWQKITIKSFTLKNHLSIFKYIYTNICFHFGKSSLNSMTKEFFYQNHSYFIKINNYFQSWPRFYLVQ